VTDISIIPYPKGKQGAARSGNVNLEAVERRCLRYLEEAANPLVPISELVVYCRREADCARLTDRDLLDFLRGHEQVRILDPPEDEDAEDARDAGSLETQVMLKKRMPTPQEISGLMTAQMDRICEALQVALRQAEATKDDTIASQVSATLERARLLQQKIHRLF